MIKLKKTKDGWIYHDRPPNKYELSKTRELMWYLGLKQKDIIFNDRTILAPREIDVWIPKHKTGIEFQGYPYHKDNKIKEIDKWKRDKCDILNIKLIQVFYWQKPERIKKLFYNRKSNRENSYVFRKKVCKAKANLDFVSYIDSVKQKLNHDIKNNEIIGSKINEQINNKQSGL